MRSEIIRRLMRAVTVLAFVCALVATGFGHRLPSSVDTALAAYVAAGGSVSDLCADTDGKGGVAHQDCPACTIAATADLPASFTTIIEAQYVLIATVDAPRAEPVLRQVRDPARGLRAPPLA